jgi:hypothetical protein
MVNVQEVLDYLGLDETDGMTDRNIELLIDSADAFLRGAVGEDYPTDDPRVKNLSLIIINDLYENRGSTEKVSTKVKSFVTSSMLQLQLEYRRSKENDNQ